MHTDSASVPRVVFIATIVALLLSPRELVSQPARQLQHSEDSLSLSVDDALQRLSPLHPELAGARAIRELAEATRGEARAALRNRVVPLTSASFSSQRLAQNQFTAIARRAGLTPTSLDNADPFTQVFAAPNIRTATLTALIRPFDAGVARAQFQAAAGAVDVASFTEAQMFASLELAVVERYADVQLNRRLVQVADSAYAQVERTLQVTQQSLEAGRAAAFDVWRVETALAAQRQSQIDAYRQARLAELALRQLLELPPEIPLRLVSNPAPWAGASGASSTVPGKGRLARLALRAANAREQEAMFQRRAAQRALLPAIDVSLQHQRFAYPLQGSNFGGPYFQNTTVAATVTLPLDLTGGSASRVELATAALRLAQAERRAAEYADERERLDVALLLESAAAAWQAAVAGASSAEQAYRVATTRFEVGRSSLLEVQDAQMALQQALANQARAARDRTVAEARAARFDRLPILPLQP